MDLLQEFFAIELDCWATFDDEFHSEANSSWVVVVVVVVAVAAAAGWEEWDEYN